MSMPDELIGQVITVLCLNYYSYTGKLVEIGATCLKLENPIMTYNEIVPRLTERTVERLPATFWYVELTAIESFGLAG